MRTRALDKLAKRRVLIVKENMRISGIGKNIPKVLLFKEEKKPSPLLPAAVVLNFRSPTRRFTDPREVI